MSRSSIIAIVVFVVLTGLVLAMKMPATRRLQANMLDVVRPIHATTSNMGRNLGAFGKGLKSLEELENENELLIVENQKLRATNQTLNDLAEQNDNLRKALDFQKRSSYRLLPARIISRSSTTWWSQVQIDRGEADGVEDDMPVVTDLGLVGKTTTVGRNTAYVLLVSDENCKVAVRVEGTKEQGIISGERVSANAQQPDLVLNVQPDLTLNFLSKNAKFPAGTKVLSLGVSGGVFPPNLLLGTIKESQPRALDARATVAPAVDLSRLENVFVILSSNRGPKK
jgi:rod shape-determining protein MreC